MEDLEKTSQATEKTSRLKALLAGVQKSILENNGQVQALETAIALAKTAKEKDGLQKSLERYTKSVSELKQSDLEIVAANEEKKTYVVHAGKFGVRKVQL